MGGGTAIAWQLCAAHRRFTTVKALLGDGIDTLYIDASVLMHKAIMKEPYDARPGADLTSFIQVCLEDLAALQICTLPSLGLLQT